MKLLWESRTGPGSGGQDEEESLLIAFSKVLAIGIRQENEMLCSVVGQNDFESFSKSSKKNNR